MTKQTNAARGPTSGDVSPKYSGLPTFMRLPLANLANPPDVVLLGVPFDGGSSVRPGSRFAPRAIRDASTMLRPYNPAYEFSPFERLAIADAEDAPVNPLDLQASLAAIERTARVWHEARARVLAIGGDHLVTLPLLRGLHSAEPQHGHAQLAVIHIDAHSDTEDEFFGSRYNHGTVFRRAVEEALIAPELVHQIGLRGSTYSAGELDFAQAAGFSLYTCEAADALGPELLASRIRSRIGRTPAYLSFDIDGIDPVFAPGTGTPEIAGLDVKYCLRLLRSLRGLNIVGADLVEVSPPYDLGQQTANVAAHLLFEILCLMAAVEHA